MFANERPFPSVSPVVDVPCGSGCPPICSPGIQPGFCVVWDYGEYKCCPPGWVGSVEDPTGQYCSIIGTVYANDEECLNSGGTVEFFALSPPNNQNDCEDIGGTWYPPGSGYCLPQESAFCGVKLKSPIPSSKTDCYDCTISENIFLNCYVTGFTAKLGINGSESSVSIDLIEAITDPCPPCESMPNCSPNPSLSCSSNRCAYDGRLGNIYTFQIGGFCFRGLLANHQYSEGSSGFKYQVSLTDGRSVLDSVYVILNDYYLDVPSSLKPNVINVLYNLEKSINDDYCNSGNKCKDFMKSGFSSRRGMFIKTALEGINNQPIQMPISGSCLLLDVTALINNCSKTSRVSSTESSVLKLITFACEESGFDFIIKIEGNRMVVLPIDRRTAPAENDLYTFIQRLSSNFVVSSRNYGQELTFERNKRLLLGENYHYLISIDGKPSSETPPSDPKTNYLTCLIPTVCWDSYINQPVLNINTSGDCKAQGSLEHNIWLFPNASIDPGYGTPIGDRKFSSLVARPGAFSYNRVSHDLIQQPYIFDPPNRVYPAAINASPSCPECSLPPYPSCS
jgi:hypothetical protein